MEISKFLKYAFIIDGLIALVYGLILLLIPEQHMAFFGYPFEEFADRFTGGMMVAFGIGNLLAYRASSWENVELVIYMNMAFSLICSTVMLYSFAVGLLPIAAFLQIGLMMFLFLLFLYAYYEAKMKNT
ncbi:MAG: hypothetical protein E3J86_12560 [Candidatus Thorarchaeota archaeon]|nr:MAG: hypothetical protein E3J86_12560 [Candidatus Thorarchaeota archaeon]